MRFEINRDVTVEAGKDQFSWRHGGHEYKCLGFLISFSWLCEKQSGVQPVHATGEGIAPVLLHSFKELGQDSAGAVWLAS